MRALRGAPRPGRTGSVEVQARAAPTSSLTEFDCAVGDPGLQIFTNVSIGDKTSLLPKLSEIVARSLSKPESYVCVHVVDQQAMCWGGDPTAGCALGSVFSIGSITKENNAQACRSNLRFKTDSSTLCFNTILCLCLSSRRSARK